MVSGAVGYGAFKAIGGTLKATGSLINYLDDYLKISSTASKYNVPIDRLKHVVYGNPANLKSGGHYYEELMKNYNSGKIKIRYHQGSEITSVSELDSAIAAGKSFNFMDVVNKNGIWGDAPKTVFKKGTTIDQIGKYMNELSKNGTLDPDPLKAGQYTIKVGGIKVNGFLSNTRTPMTVFPSN